MSSRLRWTPLVLVGLGAVLPLQATWAERPPVAPADARALTELAPPRPSPPPSTEWTPPEDGDTDESVARRLSLPTETTFRSVVEGRRLTPERPW